jgi:hypothetical protein
MPKLKLAAASLLGAGALLVAASSLAGAWPVALDEKPAEKPAAVPKISVEPASFDFGKALPEKTLEKQFSIRNFGEADLRIEGVTTTCGCTAALLDDAHKVLKPGESGQLRVRLETRQYSGKVVRSVLVRSNDPENKLVEVKVEATVQAAR